MNISIRKLCMTGILILTSFSLGGCASGTSSGKKETLSAVIETEEDSQEEIFGGGMVRNTTLYSGKEEMELSFELPVISRKELKEIKVDHYRITGEGDYRITQGETTAGDVYQGWYYYYIHLMIALDNDPPASFSIDSMDVTIDGKAYSYTPGCMKFYNIPGFYHEEIPDDSGILLYKDTPEVILSTIPSDKAHPVSISLEVNEDCTITGFEALDFVEITNVKWKVNGTLISPQEGLTPQEDQEKFTSQESRISLKKGDEVEVSFNLAYQDGYSDSDLIKTSRIFRYEDSEGKQYVLNEPHGFLLIGFENDRMIHNYIDRELTEDA